MTPTPTARRADRARRIETWLFVVVALVVLVLTLSPVPLDAQYYAAIRRVLAALHHRGAPAVLDYDAAETISNVILFLPIGLLAALLLPKRRRWLALVAPAGASIVIEIVQRLAFPHRTGSVRDVIANALGAAIGLGLATAWRAREERRAAALYQHLEP